MGRATSDGVAHIPSCGTGGLYPHSQSPSTMYSDATNAILTFSEQWGLSSWRLRPVKAASEQLLQALLPEK
jgi:hypothetical protein